MRSKVEPSSPGLAIPKPTGRGRPHPEGRRRCCRPTLRHSARQLNRWRGTPVRAQHERSALLAEQCQRQPAGPAAVHRHVGLSEDVAVRLEAAAPRAHPHRGSRHARARAPGVGGARSLGNALAGEFEGGRTPRRAPAESCPRCPEGATRRSGGRDRGRLERARNCRVGQRHDGGDAMVPEDVLPDSGREVAAHVHVGDGPVGGGVDPARVADIEDPGAVGPAQTRDLPGGDEGERGQDHEHEEAGSTARARRGVSTAAATSTPAQSGKTISSVDSDVAAASRQSGM